LQGCQKPVLDALKNLGYIRDDSPQWLSLLSPIYLSSTRKAKGTEIQIFLDWDCHRQRKDNLLALQPNRFKVTTNSNHKFEIYLNLAARMKLTAINQLWVADITYIRLKAEFVYLAVILDGFSRKVVGWALDRTLGMRLTVGALEQAIERRQPKPGLVHHSDRGLQYARGEYIALLEKHHMIPSMSRPANPFDNANCESFIKTLKREEIYANKYDNLEQLRTNIEEFIDEYYNRQRLHSALAYCSPEEFERKAENRGATIEVFVNTMLRNCF
jgi:transposase InsO family protein